MKTSRMPVIPRRTPGAFGLFALLETKRVTLPLKGVECDFSVLSGLNEVSMTQIFKQDNEKPLDCEYLFPLPADASVYYCEADINGRTIVAQVRERQEARKLAAEKKAAGFRTALVEAERENLFTLSLGNVQPGDLVIIQVKYFQTLRSLAGMPSIEIPFCPGIRYIPGAPLVRSNKGKGVTDDTDQVPDASRISPVRIDAEHPDAAYVEVRGTLEGKFINETELTSPSHSIVVHRTGDQLRVSLSDKAEVPDRDFVLRWSERNVDALASRTWFCEKDKETYALLEVRAPQAAPTERPPVDFYFLVDRSGSMSGEKWNKAAEALKSCVSVLGPADRVMVTFFESRFQDYAEGLLSAAELLRDSQFQTIEKLGIAGGTELRGALKHVLALAAEHSEARTKNLILITDAQIGNESAILQLMESAPDLPVHCFGIDVALNDSLLLALSRQQGGTFHSLNPSDDIQKAVTALGRTLGQPVLLDLELGDGWEAADAVIPNLYAGQVHYLSARAPSGRSIELRARDVSSQPVTVQFDPQRTPSQAAYLHWCRSRMQRLVAEGRNEAAIALSVESNLICPLTAFIAWDESEKVSIATHALAQPSLLLDVSYCKVMPEEFSMAEAQAATLAQFPSAATSERGALFDRLIGAMKVDREMLRSRRASDEELDLKRELSELCHQAGVADWQQPIKRIFDWIAQASKAERARRIEEVRQLLKALRSCLAAATGQESKRDQTDSAQKAQQLLKEFTEKFCAGTQPQST